MELTRESCFDLESYPDYFCCVIDGRTFHLEDADRLQNAMSRLDTLYTSYNGIGYDINILGYIFWHKQTYKELPSPGEIHEVSNFIVEDREPVSERPALFVREHLNTFTYIHKGEPRKSHKLNSSAHWNPNISVCDLYLVGNRQGGLKKAAIVLDLEDLSECPVPFDQLETSREERKLIDLYCAHDVKVTRAALEYYKDPKRRDDIGIRYLYGAKMGITDAFALGAAGLSERFFVWKMKQEFGQEAGKLLEDQKKWREEEVPQIRARDVIRCGELDIKDSGFSSIQSTIRTSKIDFEFKSNDGEPGENTKKNESTKIICGKKRLTRDDLCFNDDHGHTYQFGVGGLHDVPLEGVWEEDETHILVLVDVKSYYPSLVRSWGICPRFIPNYDKSVNECLEVRLLAKKNPALKGEAESLKLFMNSSTGKLGERHNPLFDPKAYYSITFTGQMGLFYLIDKIYANCGSAEVVNANTDGICVKILRSEEDKFKEACLEWEKILKVNLEFEHYKRWVQKSCNLYCALRDDGKVKAKGVTFLLDASDLGKGYPMARAVKHMVVKNMLFGEDMVKIARSLEPKLYLVSKSCGSKTRFVYDGEELVGRTSIRYVFGGRHGHTLQSKNVASGKNSSVQDGANVILIDKLEDLDINKIQIERYVLMAKEIVDSIKKSNLEKEKINNGFFSPA